MAFKIDPNQLIIPASILVAGALVAGAVLFVNSGASAPSAPSPAEGRAPVQGGSTDNIAPITGKDHIRGNPDAPVKIVEYSDYECPFCKRFHPTMQQIMEEYGKDGRVAWVYRHFPLDQLHPVKARREAATAECVNELGGNDAFWRFSDRFFELTPSNNQTDLETVLPAIIGELGLSWSAVDECVKSGKYDAHIQADYDNAIETGGQGTPWSIVIGPDGSTFPLSGAQPTSAVRQLVEIVLKDR